MGKLIAHARVMGVEPAKACMKVKFANEIMTAITVIFTSMRGIESRKERAALRADSDNISTDFCCAGDQTEIERSFPHLK